MCVCVCVYMYVACVGWMMVKRLVLVANTLIISVLSDSAPWAVARPGMGTLAWLVQLMGDEAQSRRARPHGHLAACQPVPGDFTAQGFLGPAAILCPLNSDFQALTGSGSCPHGFGRSAAGHSPAYQPLHAGLSPGFVHSPLTGSVHVLPLLFGWRTKISLYLCKHLSLQNGIVCPTGLFTAFFFLCTTPTLYQLFELQVFLE